MWTSHIACVTGCVNKCVRAAKVRVRRVRNHICMRVCNVNFSNPKHHVIRLNFNNFMSLHINHEKANRKLTSWTKRWRAWICEWSAYENMTKVVSNRKKGKTLDFRCMWAVYVGIANTSRDHMAANVREIHVDLMVYTRYECRSTRSLYIDRESWRGSKNWNT